MKEAVETANEAQGERSTGLKPGVNESSAARAQLQMEQSRTSQMPGEKCDANEVARGCLHFALPNPEF